MNKNCIIFLLFIFLLKLNLVNLWNLRAIKELGNFTVKHVSIYYMRSFLCIENLNENKNQKLPTLIEGTWPENILPITPSIFPSIKEHSKTETDCTKIQNAACSDIDRKARLWVIDNGSKFCPPKLITYLIVPWNEEIIRANINDVQSYKISSLICDLKYNINGTSRGFISVHDYDFLLVFYLKERKFGKIQFREYNTIKDLPFFPTEIAWGRKNHLYLSNNKTGELYSLNLSKIKTIDEFDVSNNMLSFTTPLWSTPVIDESISGRVSKASLKYIGTLLGPSTSLTTDSNGNIYYALPRDGAVVRCKGKQPLTAEKHDVLFQISSVVVQILFGVRGSVWIVTATSGSYFDSDLTDHCIRILTHYTSQPTFFEVNESEDDSNYYIF